MKTTDSFTLDQAIMKLQKKEISHAELYAPIIERINKDNKVLFKQITPVITKLCSRDYHSGISLPELELKWFGHLKHESVNAY